MPSWKKRTLFMLGFLLAALYLWLHLSSQLEFWSSTLFLSSRGVNRSSDRFKPTKSTPKKSHLQSVSQVSREVRHVAFLKVHKTGSSTAQNIFLRFGDSRNLTFILAHTRGGETGYANVISFRNSITKSNIVPEPKGKSYQMLCCHVIYNRTSFEKVLPHDTVYIGIVREPLNRFQSHIKMSKPKYIMNISSEHPISVFAANPLKYEHPNPRKSWTNNRMAVEFGFPEHLFPGKSSNDSIKEISKYLQKIDKEFALIIINERFTESVVFMKRLLGWSIKDVLYMDHFVNDRPTRPRENITEADKKLLYKFLLLDVALYQFALARFENQIRAEGNNFQNEVEYFKFVKRQVDKFCQEKKERKQKVQKAKKEFIHFNATNWGNEFYVTTSDCELLLMGENNFIRKERMRQYGSLNN